MIRTGKVDATKGALIPLIFRYAIPLMLATLMQKLFNAMDVAVLGHLASNLAVASVGATTVIVHLLVDAFFGFSGGSKIILARHFGAKNEDLIKKVSGTSLLLALFIGVGAAAVGIVFGPWLLQATNCPENCMEGAVLYLRIYVCGAPAMMLYNAASSILTASGDSQRPLYYIIFSGFLNLILNVLLCLLLPQKVIAVAVATVASQLMGALLACRRLAVMDGIGRVDFKKLKWDTSSFGNLMRYGLPLCLTTGMYPLATLQIQSGINSFGDAAISGSTTAVTLEGVPSSFSGAFSTATTTFVGQNIGAGQYERAKKAMRYCLVLSVLLCGGLGVFMYVTGEFWVSLILPNAPEALPFAMTRMKYVVLPYAIAAINSVLTHAIQAYGYPVFSTCNSIFFVLVFRVIWMSFIYPKYQTFDNLMLCFLVSWLCMLVCNIIGFFILKRRFFRKLKAHTPHPQEE